MLIKCTKSGKLKKLMLFPNKYLTFRLFYTYGQGHIANHIPSISIRTEIRVGQLLCMLKQNATMKLADKIILICALLELIHIRNWSKIMIASGF